MLKNQHRIVVAHGRFQNSFRVISVRDRHHFQARYTGKVSLHVLRMLRSASRRADRRPHHQRHLATAAGHVPHFSRVIDDLITGQEKKIAILHIGDRSHAHHGCADRDSKKAKLSDRRVNHPVRKPFFQTESHRKCAAPAARHRNVFADTEDGLISFHFFGDGVPQSFGDCLSFHVWSGFLTRKRP